MNLFRNAVFGLAALIFGVASTGDAFAQASPPTPAPSANLVGRLTISVTNSTSTPQALPLATTPFGVLTLYNSGSKDAYCAAGGISIAAMTSSPWLVPAGQSLSGVWTPGAYVTCITGGSDTTTVVVLQANGPIPLNSAGLGGGALPVGAATSANQSTQITAEQAIQANTATGATRTVVGAAASGATASGNPLLNGARAASTAPTPVTDGQAVALMATGEGKLVVAMWSPEALRLRGANSATTTGATTFTGMGAQGASIKIYVTGVQCFRTDAGTTTSYVTLNDSASTTVILPVGGGSNVPFNTPLSIAANTAFQFTPHDALTTVFCNAQGYQGP